MTSSSQACSAASSDSGRRRVFCIINPTGGGGKAKKVKPALIAALRAEFVGVRIEETTCSGDATLHAEAAVREGYNVVVAVGGDGTLSEVIHGLYAEATAVHGDSSHPVSPPSVVYFACGTGADFAKLGLCCRSESEVVSAIKAGERKPVDVGAVTYFTDRVNPLITGAAERVVRGRRFFVNVSSIGLSHSVVTRAEKLKSNWCLRACGGTAIFFAASFVELLKMAPKRFHLRRGVPFFPPTVSDGGGAEPVGEWIPVSATNIAFCNGRYFGGGMQVAPTASPSDGQLEVTVWTEKFCGFLCGLPSVYSGKHVAWKSTTTFTGHCWEITDVATAPSSIGGAVAVDVASESSGGGTCFEVDGEKGLSLPAVVEIAGSITFLRPTAVV